jgi:hypothetical protein
LELEEPFVDELGVESKDEELTPEPELDALPAVVVTRAEPASAGSWPVASCK